eukprot:s4312_g3.t1
MDRGQPSGKSSSRGAQDTVDEVVATAAQNESCKLPFATYLWQCAQTPSDKHGSFASSWCHNLFEHFRPGETVAVDNHSNKRHCHATVLAPRPEGISPDPGPANHDELFVGLRRRIMQADQMQVLLQSADGRIFGCSSGRVVRVLPSSPARVLVVYDTTTYRRLAKTQVGKDDGILEVGSSFGECTSILASHAAVVVGVDNSPKLVEESSRRYPVCRFELLDCFKEPAPLRVLCAEIQQASSNFKLFVDIGGDRMTSGVCHALVVLESLWCGPGSGLKQPSLVVVKSEGLSEAAAVACDSQSSICDTANWWQTCARPSGSRRQLKRQSHTTEMLKQMPACP